MPDDELDAATLLDHAWPEPILVCYNRRDLLLYALGIGCDELCFVHEDSSAFAAFPTYPAVLGFKGDALDVVSFPSPAMMQSPMPFLPGTRVILDAERYIERVRPLPTDGGSLLLRTKLVGVLPKGKGALLQTESELSDASGTLLYRLQAASFAVGAKGFKRAGMAQLYRLSGDYNPLHIDPDVAQTSGFERPILHGLCSLGFAVHAVLLECAGGDEARFRAGAGRVIFETEVVETGAAAIKHAYVDLHTDESPPARL